MPRRGRGRRITKSFFWYRTAVAQPRGPARPRATQEAPASLFYAASLTKNAVGVFAHAQPDLLAAKEFIDCVGFAVARQCILVERDDATGRNPTRACLVIIGIEIEQRDPRAQSTASVRAWSRRRHLQSTSSARSPGPDQFPQVLSVPLNRT
jgi:hypothetical protein